MPTSPPNFHSMVKSKESMAVAQHKQKSASRSNSSKEKVQMHRRSRTGCYTCRLRRKKCDEGSPACTACRNLGLRCEYKRPMWWGNNEQRRQQKENIKIIIKRKKLAEKNTLTSNKAMTSRDETTPSLLHSLSTSGTFVDSLGRSRSTSIDSHLSLFEFTGVPHHTDLTGYSNQIHSNQYASFLPGLPPFEMDVGAEQDMFVKHLANSCESTVPHYCNFDLNQDWFNEDISSGNLFDLSHDYTLTPAVHTLDLNDRDLRFLDHFIMDVLPSIFPILEIHPERSARLEHVMLALKTNKCYTHCCLSIAAQHCKATMKIQGNQIDSDIIRHRFATVSELCEALNRDTDHNAVLDATLGMILFQGAVGRFEDSLPDIPWHQHFEAAVSLVQKLDLLRHFSESHDHNSIPFNMPLTAWIDILGATMHGRSPTFAHTYRDKYLSSPDASFGLRSLMGCDDRVMFLISEIACLEDLKRSGIDDLKLCQMVHALGDQISLSEIDGPILGTPCNFQGLLRPQQLTSNVTAAFRIAARIYLCSLVPGFTPSQPSCVGLVNKLTQVLEYIPSGPTGFDRSLIWVYLISGSVSTAASPFRTIYIERMRSLGERATLGTLGNLTCILEEIWSQSDMLQDFDTGEVSYISWRDVMCRNDRDFLLI